VYLNYRPAFNIFYIDLSAGDRMKIKNILKEKMKAIFSLNLPFFMFVSNGEQPLIITDSTQFAEFLSKIGILYGAPPSPGGEINIIEAKINPDSLLNSTSLRHSILFQKKV
jgi:hypothetical protein